MLTAIPVAGKAKSRDICDAFIAGAPRTAKGFVTYGVNDTNHAEFLAAKATGLPIWQIDNSYFDKARGLFFRVTKNRLQHTGLGETDGKRFARLGIEVKPFVHFSHGPVIVVEQSDSFMRIHAGEAPRPTNRPTRGAGSGIWLHAQMAEHVLGRKVKFRAWHNDKIKQGLGLAVDLQGASLLITHSSAAAVEALRNGVPVVVSPLSCCYGHRPADRERLFGVLADNQFTLNEMKDGTAWAALNK